MANPEHVEIVKQGAEAIFAWRETNRKLRLDLSRADLEEAELDGADLSEADLGGANLSGARCFFTDLSQANLVGADLRGADLSGVALATTRFIGPGTAQTAAHSTNFPAGSDLSKADLSEAILSGANLTGTVLDGTRFKAAIIGWTVLGDVDLSTAKELETIRHQGPSIIGIDTLYRSRGKIPETFLRGCGVPDGLIAHLPSLLGAQHAIQFYSCFISYSHKDEEFAKRLYSRMRDEHLRVWYAPEDMKGGRKIHEQINEAIRVHDKLLLVLSDNSMASEWVKTEVRRARRREAREGRRVLFPIRLLPFDRIRDWESFDADTGKDMGVEIREYFIPDFSNWKDRDSFEAAFKRLLADLKAEADRDAGGSGGEG